MKAISYTELRKNMKENLDLVVDSDETIIVHRPGDKTVVIISLEKYNSMIKTGYSFRKK